EGKRIDQGSKKPLDFRPDQKIEISLAPYADELRAEIEKLQPFSSIHTCFINVVGGFYEDGMQWVLSVFNAPDPKHLGQFIPVVDRSQYLVLDQSKFVEIEPETPRYR